MTNNVCAVDTNVLLYLHDKSALGKRALAMDILSDNPIVSTQVISEFINVSRRQLSISKADILLYCAELLKGCEISSVTSITLLAASILVKRFDFQIFDSIIGASAIESGGNILYSEDMQHGMKVDNLLILNPFV